MAGMVSDAFGHFSRQPLTQKFDARWFSVGRFQRALIGQKMALRFKKLTPDLTSMSTQTDLQRGVYQQNDGTLPGAQAVTNITLGYTLDHLRATVTGLYFACPVDFDKNAWILPIYQAGGQMSLFEGTPLPPTDLVENVLDVDIKVKKRGKTEHG